MDEFDAYEAYEAQFDPLLHDRKARRKRKPRKPRKAGKARAAPAPALAETADAADTASRDEASGEGGAAWHTTYQPSLFEEGWLYDSLRPFYERGLITDVLARVKGGKEANVYRCAAHPGTGFEFLAAKVYRPRMFRNLRNDKQYREGREVVSAEGKVVKKTDHRAMRALGKKTAFGVQLAHTSWLMYEYTSLQRLHAIGVSVPQPVASAENALLMGYYGDADGAAPALNEVRLERDEAEPLYHAVLRSIERMLHHDLIHGDLSAYNILYWDGEIVLIDFPQVVDSQRNTQAYAILQRDVTRVCEYFARQGVPADANAVLRRLWQRYMRPIAERRAADALIQRDTDA